MKDPLQTLVSRDQYETAYAVLAHFLLIAQRAPILFSQVAPAGLNPFVLACKFTVKALWIIAAHLCTLPRDAETTILLLLQRQQSHAVLALAKYC